MRMLIAAMLSVVLLTACETLDKALTRVAESNAVIRAGTAEYIDRDAERAERVIAWVDEAIEDLSDRDDILLTRLQEEASKRIPWDRLSPGQAILANELLYRIEARIHEKIDEGVLSEDAVANIVHVLETVREQAVREKSRATEQTRRMHGAIVV